MFTRSLGVLVLASAGALFGGTTTITFDGFGFTPGNDSSEAAPAGTIIAGQIPGLVFSTTTGSDVFATNSTYRTAYDPNRTPTDQGFAGTYLGFNEIPHMGAGGDLFVDFIGGAYANSVSVVVNDTEADDDPPAGVTIELYDGLTFLGSVDLSPSYATDFVNFGWLTPGLIATHLRFVSDGDGFLADNLSFTPVGVIPEPGTFGLLGAALLGIGLLRRKS
jgi:hypothetical protein